MAVGGWAILVLSIYLLIKLDLNWGSFAVLYNSKMLFYTIFFDVILRFPSSTRLTQRRSQYPIPNPLFRAFYRHHADLNTISWNIFPTSTKKNLCQVLLLDQDPRFKMSSTEAPDKPALEFDTDLVQWAPVSTPDFIRMLFSHPDIVEKTIGLWGWIKLKKFRSAFFRPPPL